MSAIPLERTAQLWGISGNLGGGKTMTAVQFAVNAIRDGYFVVSNITLNVDNPKEILKYRLTYLNDTNIEVGDVLASEEVKTIKVRIEYPETNTKIYDALTLKLNLVIEFSTIH